MIKKYSTEQFCYYKYILEKSKTFCGHEGILSVVLPPAYLLPTTLHIFWGWSEEVNRHCVSQKRAAWGHCLKPIWHKVQHLTQALDLIFLSCMMHAFTRKQVIFRTATSSCTEGQHSYSQVLGRLAVPHSRKAAELQWFTVVKKLVLGVYPACIFLGKDGRNAVRAAE